MDVYLNFLRALWDQAAAWAGADWKLIVLASGVFLVWAVLGTLLVTHVFKKDRGVVMVVLACSLPVLGGLATWAGVEVFLDLPVFEIGGNLVGTSQVVAILMGVGLGWFLGKPLLNMKGLTALFYLLLVYAGSVGGFLLAQASLTVFEAGQAKMEEREGEIL